MTDYSPTDAYYKDESLYEAVWDAFLTLSDTERYIVLLYAETGSASRLSKKFGMSHTCAVEKVKRTIKKLKRRIKRNAI